MVLLTKAGWNRVLQRCLLLCCEDRKTTAVSHMEVGAYLAFDSSISGVW